jgi:hypothetical protein
MSDSAPQPSKSSASGANRPPGSVDGVWKLDLMNGTVWFSEWFYRRLHWPVQVNRKRLGDLRPYLQEGAWETLLQGIRAHLERQVPLDAKIFVQLPGGQIEWWRMQGSAEHNALGKPVYLRGSVRDVSAEHRPDAADPQP